MYWFFVMRTHLWLFVQYFASTYVIYLSQNIYLKLLWFRGGDRFLCNYLFCWSAFCLHLLSSTLIKSHNITQNSKIVCMLLVRERSVLGLVCYFGQRVKMCIVLCTVFLCFSLSIQNLVFILVICGFYFEHMAYWYMYSLTVLILKTLLEEHKVLLEGRSFERRLFISVCKNENKNS